MEEFSRVRLGEDYYFLDIVLQDMKRRGQDPHLMRDLLVESTADINMNIESDYTRIYEILETIVREGNFQLVCKF